MGRLEPLMDLTEKVITLANGNPGAVRALAMAAKAQIGVDFDPLSKLDDLEIYGTDVYVLFNDVCDNNAVRFVALLMAHDLDCVSAATISAGLTQSPSNEKDALRTLAAGAVEAVRAQVPNFAPNYTEPN